MSTPVTWEHLIFMESATPGEVHSYKEISPSGCAQTDFGTSCRAQTVETMTTDGTVYEFTPRSFGDEYQAALFVCLSPLDDPPPMHSWTETGECSAANGGYSQFFIDVCSAGGEWELWGLSFMQFSGVRWCVVLDPAHTGPVPQFQYDSSNVIRLIRRAGNLIVSVEASLPDFDAPAGVWVVSGDRAEYTYSTPAVSTNQFTGHAAFTEPLNDQPEVPGASANAPLRLVVFARGAVDVEPEHQPGITASIDILPAAAGYRYNCNAVNLEVGS